MVGIAVITHGKFAEGIKDSLRMIVGEQENFTCLGLQEAQGLEEFKQAVMATISAADDGSGVLVCVDLFGATPFNAVSMLRNELLAEKKEAYLVTGVNLPLLLEAIVSREGADPADLAKRLVTSGRESIESLDLR